MIEAGRLDRRVTIQQPTTVISSTGGTTQTWANLVQVWAAKRDVAGREAAVAGLMAAGEAETVWQLHWREGITPKMRLIDGSTIYNITAVAELGRRQGLELRTKRAA